jgi:hypothetical protein
MDAMAALGGRRADMAIARLAGYPGPEGPGLHRRNTVTKTDGIGVADVWRTREGCDKFTRGQIMWITDAVGVPKPSQITYCEAHNHLTAG